MRLRQNKGFIRIGAIVVLLILLITNIASPFSAFAVNLSSQLGTNKALGSPLLNDSFDYDSWNKWELMTFGVFLSNLTNPLVDSYKTAFTVNTKGSAGAGKKALEFGSGSDSVGNKALASMLDYAVKNQTASAGKPIQAIYTQITKDGSTDEEPKQATIVDLLIYCKDGVTRNWDIDFGARLPGADDGPVIEEVYTGNGGLLAIDGYPVFLLEKARLCKLVVEGDSQGQLETIFDWQNGWDAQMMAAWIAKVTSSEHADIALQNLGKMVEAKTPLFMDTFGNICGKLDGENIIIIPSAANCHIYNEPKYNLLNSVILSEAYTDASGKTLNKSLEAYKWDVSYHAGRPLKTKGGLKKGDIIVYFDSDYAIFESISKKRTDILAGNYDDIKMNWGTQTIRLLNSRLDKNVGSNTLGIKIEVVGGERQGEGILCWIKAAKNELKRLSEDLVRASNMLVAFYPVPAGKDVLATITTEKGDAPLFGQATYVPVNCWEDDDKYNTAIRDITNSAYKYLDGTSSAANASLSLANATSLKSELMTKERFIDVANWLFYEDPTQAGDNGKLSKLVKNSILGSGKALYTLPSNASEIFAKSIAYKDLDSKKISMANGTGLFNDKKAKNIANSEDKRKSAIERVLKVYTKNENMKSAMNVLNVREGTEFALWTPRVYLSYLQWFGILDGTNDFNKHLFSESSDILNKDAKELFSGTFLTKEEKEQEVLNYTYLMLHPTEGREYRSEMMMNWFTDWMYKTYQNIVYGNAVDSYNTSSNTGTRSAAGFLHMDSYQDNFMTSWFMEGYAKYAVVIMGVMLIGIVVIGLLNQKTAAWFLVSLILMVNIVLVTPMIGEVTPYVANNAVQGMFTSKMTYWAMAESIANAKLEKEMSTTEGGESGLSVTDYVRMLNVVYLDRSIMLRADISKKITEDSTGIINEVQSLASARWLLPTMIRQFSASDGSANYVYQPIGDIYDNYSNMYWVYHPDDKLNVVTSNSNTVETIDETEVPLLDLSSKTGRYAGYKDTSAQITEDISEDADETTYLTYPWQSVSRLKDDSDVSHAGFYLIPGLLINDANGAWDEYATNLNVDSDSFRAKAIEMEQQASSYDPAKTGAKPNFGFLWTTENPGHYFYQLVKDTFGSSKTMAGLAGDLQGYYKVSTTTGDEERQSFMHYRDTGDIRDFLDMEELFTNVIPYMYSVQLMACGTDGTNGVLGDTKMTNYGLYEDNYKSWLFRSNWVTKIMEDKDLTRPMTIGDGNGGKVKVENPMLPSSYEAAGRKMVFSEAQLNQSSLTEADLSLVELKILKVNKAVERKWTLLINYINTADITTEVFYRQMATDALLEFNKEFSPDRFINGTKALYPTSLDLRSISFDSVMKMLMINATRDSSYIYGDTMKQVIENSDIFSAILMLLSAFCCSFLIPFIRNIVLGLIFYLGFWAVICNILAGGITKLKITTAYAINNIVYMAATLVYYAVYALLINTSTADSVLSVGNIVINAGPPTWQFFIILGSSIAYIWVSFKLINFTIKNYRDLGFEVYASWGNMMANKLANGINGIKDKLGFGGGAAVGAAGGAAVGGAARRSRADDIEAGRVELDIDDRGTGRRRRELEEERNQASARSGYEMDRVQDTSDEGSNYFDEESDRGSRL